ncbi:MAG: Lrp/AsnC family transcriptional regulator [Candidatus Competibacteraceae bacterium]|nr:Lrp/AsnC family transcriptional regulator [Candidatus Competibacteraceae bacterium]
MNVLSQRLINEWQSGFPLCERPFAYMAERLDSDEETVLHTLQGLLADGVLTRFGPLYRIERLGGAFSLAALSASIADFDKVASIVNRFPQVAHNYQRDHILNMWFVLATETPDGIDRAVQQIAAATGLPVHNFPKEREYFLDARFIVGGKRRSVASSPPSAGARAGMRECPNDELTTLLPTLRPLILATQAGLPCIPRPYHALAAELGMPVEAVLSGLQTLLDAGAIRRIGVVPNHYRIGYSANGMMVWDVVDATVDEWGARIGALEFVTHCYRRPRHLPDWPYNLFAMAHGQSRAEINARVEEIAGLLGKACRSHAVLYSTRILKKTGLRLTG